MSAVGWAESYSSPVVSTERRDLLVVVEGRHWTLYSWDADGLNHNIAEERGTEPDHEAAKRASLAAADEFADNRAWTWLLELLTALGHIGAAAVAQGVESLLAGIYEPCDQTVQCAECGAAWWGRDERPDENWHEDGCLAHRLLVAIGESTDVRRER